jgi:hypothetical protein
MEQCHISQYFGIENNTLCLNYRIFFRLQIILRYVTFAANKQNNFPILLYVAIRWKYMK